MESISISLGYGGIKMSDLFDRVTGDQDIFKKLLSKVPGFSGYIERANRRSSDKLLRGVIGNRFEEQWGRISSIQRDLISQGGLAYVDDLEQGAIKLRQFIDRVKTASYGYSSFFEAVKVNEEELANIYKYDASMLDMADEVARSIDNLEASLGTDGLPAAIRNMVGLTQKCVDAFQRRSEVILGGADGKSQ
jgi:hypothetical protein